MKLAALTALLLMTGPLQPGPKHRLALSDQALFRQWVHALALNFFTTDQKNRKTERWSDNNRDCAGFIRYIIWEAFAPHNSRWHMNFGSYLTRPLPDLRVKRPALFAGQVKSAYASARQLWQFNSYPVDRQISSNLREGDILFFRNGDEFHSMLLIKDQRKDSFMVIYHTGGRKNELRIVQLGDLFEHRQTRWHPSPANPSFLGFYRLYFLD